MREIPRTVVNRILAHAQRTAPEECVGILSGNNGHITTCHPLTNSLGETQRFLADPGEQIHLFRQLRDQGQELLAIYHSHPTTPATPSPLDLEQAGYPNTLHLIVSLATDGRLELAGYQIRNGRAEEQELEVVEG